MWEYTQASTVPLFKSLAGPLRKVRVTGPEVVGVHENVDDSPAVTVKPGGVFGGFDVAPDCAATAAIRHATTEKMRILNEATRMLCVLKKRDEMKERERERGNNAEGST